jgi:hypothetical protein
MATPLFDASFLNRMPESEGQALLAGIGGIITGVRLPQHVLLVGDGKSTLMQITNHIAKITGTNPVCMCAAAQSRWCLSIAIRCRPAAPAEPAVDGDQALPAGCVPYLEIHGVGQEPVVLVPKDDLLQQLPVFVDITGVNDMAFMAFMAKLGPECLHRADGTLLPRVVQRKCQRAVAFGRWVAPVMVVSKHDVDPAVLPTNHFRRIMLPPVAPDYQNADLLAQLKTETGGIAAKAVAAMLAVME